MSDLDRNVLRKLQRILPQVELHYAAKSRAGLFEATGDHYGEVWYEMNGRKKMSRSTTEPIVLAALYELAQVSGPATEEESAYAGHPLAARPNGAALFFYGLWPSLAGLACWLHFRN